MSGEKKAELSAVQKMKMFEARETWCAVERKKEADWCRKTRRHYDHHLQSELTKPVKLEADSRCVFVAEDTTRPEMRHFPAVHRE